MSEATTGHACTHPGCKVTGTADRMWNLKGKVVICGRHAHEARKRGLRAYRLSDTLAYEHKIAQEQAASEAFFSKFTAKNASRGKVTLGQAVQAETVRKMREHAAT